MFEDWEINNKPINPPIDADRLKINLVYQDGTLAETQPILSLDRLVFTNSGLQEILKFKKSFGPYRQLPIKYRFSNRELFNGYLTDFKFLLDTDEIEAKPVSFDSTDGLTELLSAIESSILANDYQYTDIPFIIEKVDIRPDLIQLNLSILFYLYVLYTQIKEIARLIGRATEAAGNAAGFSFGTAAALVLEIAAQAIFVASTIIQLIRFAIELKELIIPRIRRARGVSLFELARAALSRIGYKFETEFEEMNNIIHWASGNVIDRNEHFPRSGDRCGNALSTFNFLIEKYAAKVAVRDKTVFLYSPFSDFFLNRTPYVTDDFIRGNYRENTDDMVGTREIIYSVDYQDQWTLENFRGTEYKIRANIDDPTQSTIKGLEQTDYGLALCNRKDELNAVERAWKSFVDTVNTVVSAFGGGTQTLNFENRIGVAKISSRELSVAKLVWFERGRIPENHRQFLSARSDEEKFHWIKSHVRNPRARRRIYEEIPMRYNDDSLNCNLNSSFLTTPDGIQGELKEVDWEYQYDEALVTFEIEDVNRDPRLIETFIEPEK